MSPHTFLFSFSISVISDAVHSKPEAAQKKQHVAKIHPSGAVKVLYMFIVDANWQHEGPLDLDRI